MIFLILFLSYIKCAEAIFKFKGNLKEAKNEQEDFDGGSPLLIRKKEIKMDGMMSDDEVDSALRKLCKCGNPFMRYVRLKEVGAGYVLFK